MERALALAALGQGRTSPNPLVGALVLDASGVLVGEGFHAAAGQPHAEVGALAQAADRARGGTLVVTLEPCCHHGRTPPCSEAVIAAGIRRVIVAMEDPDPRVAGQGLEALRRTGVEVLAGVRQREALSLNAAFCHRQRTGRPLGILKWAMSVDGRTALPNGASQWISGPGSREWVHRQRAGCDAVIVGGGTLRADDPLLTSRGQRAIEPLRVVISRELKLPERARLWNQATACTLVAHGPEAPEHGRRLLDRLGVERLELARCEPLELMEALALRGCNQVLWECGPTLAAASLRQGCVQRVAAVIAPKLLGGDAARTPLGDLQLSSMAMVAPWGERGLSRSGADLIWELNGPHD
ncbi:bifunctional diaminohydroxyphosphoribosylaminopyrimidine deaminase/5-amino-6-(5-phosphoribosylamino)uracil reductase RibD [Synechococcus sp. CS-205]|uniref:bifunctional diaminohydroxyphosphoribosylaminopyrimidine deaminase/5-amino-6-(5-phosphoribosylamino)uracil reductase RibD n=1 Tax=Synechococcus sp. CS-205 TaxID=2847984 RepID=UPI00223AA401|nr:bifunctional diaminohydroxyphosphoribosylaminopyrimidine deaminase/5-amino-6-(5-phosphoribosylamino)uracil reductase RibD [Synechococcus sp. CS-205]MCT0248894.1 bifunctional diaminohydroxyphosphoribosylaminopyrimidine deaminase/5-amino-6-(5-phosphoribosylamino)uracil reductase RibD [Synechococcus sp. CS-205]